MVVPFAKRRNTDGSREVWAAWQSLGLRLRRLLAGSPAIAARVVDIARHVLDEAERLTRS